MTQKTAPPEYRLLSDPTRTMQFGLTGKGALMRATMQVLPKLVYGLAGAGDDDQMPFRIKQEVQASGQSSNSSSTSHAFAGMGMQGLLFWAVESAMTILRERKMGIWKRLRASPVSLLGHVYRREGDQCNYSRLGDIGGCFRSWDGDLSLPNQTHPQLLCWFRADRARSVDHDGMFWPPCRGAGAKRAAEPGAFHLCRSPGCAC